MSEPAKLITVKIVMDRLGISRTTVWKMVKDGQFPPPVRVSPGRVAWRENDVAKWVEGGGVAA
jgi:prophage regulatory protein